MVTVQSKCVVAMHDAPGLSIEPYHCNDTTTVDVFVEVRTAFCILDSCYAEVRRLRGVTTLVQICDMAKEELLNTLRDIHHITVLGQLSQYTPGDQQGQVAQDLPRSH